MRILRVSHSAPVDAWRERERELRRRGHRVTLLSARAWREGGRVVRLRPRPGEDVTGVRTVGRHPALFLYAPLPLWRALRRSWDVIDIHEEPFALATAEVLLLRRLAGNRAPFTVYSAQNIAKRYPVPFRQLERATLAAAAGASVCSSAAGAILTRKGLRVPPSTIPLGVDATTSTDRAGPDGARSRPGTADGAAAPVTVGYAGRLAPPKGVAVLLDALALDPRLTLRVAGAGPQGPALRSQARPLGDRVRFLGPLADEELTAFYRSLDVLAVPSLDTPRWREQFGRVAAEAMACGVPVVVSDGGALPEVVGSAGVVVPQRDPAALAEALARVGTDADLAARLRSAGLARAADFAWPRVAAAYEGMYAAATGEPADPAPVLPPLEVVVVAFGRPDLVRTAVEPLADLPVTVVDNSSDAEVAAVCAELAVRYVDPGRNGGFAAGVNAALAGRRCPDGDVLLVNPDAVLDRAGALALQQGLHADPGLASVAPAQVDGSGAPARVAWPFPTPGRVWLEALGLARLPAPLRPRPAYVIGSVLLLRGTALAEVGGFDEDYFLYAEETDWALRAARLGWRHAVVGAVTAVHLGAATSTEPSRRELQFHAAQERFMRKHHGRSGWLVARAGQVVGSALRAVALPGERGRAAALRCRVYLHGPISSARAAGVRDHAQPT